MSEQEFSPEYLKKPTLQEMQDLVRFAKPEFLTPFQKRAIIEALPNQPWLQERLSKIYLAVGKTFTGLLTPNQEAQGDFNIDVMWAEMVKEWLKMQQEN